MSDAQFSNLGPRDAESFVRHGPEWLNQSCASGPLQNVFQQPVRRQSLSRWIAPEYRKADDHMLRLGGNIVWQRGRKTHATKTIVAFVVQRRDVSGDCQFQFRPGRTIADRRQRREAVMG